MQARFFFAAIAALSSLALSAYADDRAAASAGHAEVPMMDTDHDGRVSPDEHAAGAKKMFAQMDADQDGKVTAAEIDAGHKTTMKKTN
jgi:hypothetical protein